MTYPTHFRSTYAGELMRRMLLTGAFLMLLAGLSAQSAQHHLIVASFDNFTAASAGLNEILPTHPNAEILFPEPGSNRYRISAYHAANRQEVETYKRTAPLGDRKAWILTRGTTNTRGDQSSRANQRSAPAVSSNAATYHLVLTSHTDEPRAMEAVNQLTALGYEPYIVYPKPGDPVQAYRVAIYMANTRREVTAYQAMLRRGGHDDGWILKQQSAAIAPGAGANLRTRGATGDRTYYLIGGSFDRYDEASDFLQAAQAMGAPAEILWPRQGEEQGKFRVSLYKADTRASVEAYQRSLNSQGRQGGWIYVR